MLHQLVFQSLLGEIDYGAQGDFTPAGYNATGIRTWNGHGPDWIFQGGPDTSDEMHNPQYNQWGDLDDSPISWTISEPVDPCSVSPWLSAVGGGIY
mmetsp:Transcript_4345/g.6402  ORF Transcript_4345/g.6402 Transcript_4345/m.6402 type:complete len:96 (-) Transcript_4345:248-535(-)